MPKYFYPIFLSIFIFLACSKEENLTTTRAEKWSILEESLLFQNTESLAKWKEIEVNLQKQSLRGEKEAQEEIKAWKEVRRDFDLDNNQIIKAIESLDTYQVLSLEKGEESLKERLSNDMEILLENDEISIFFPKEASNFRLSAHFIKANTENNLFIGKEFGGIFSEEEAKISFDSKNYEFKLY